MGKKGPVPLIEHPSLIAKRIALVISEFLGTFTLLFLGCIGCVSGVAGSPIPHEQISFTFGFAILVAVQCFGHLSGSHVNPAVTVASVVCGHTKLILVPFYLTGQFLGAISGYGVVMLLTPSEHLNNNNIDGNGNKLPGVCSPGINPQITTLQGLVVEFIATAMLIWVCCAIWDRKNSDKHDSLSIRFGLTVAVLAMACGPYTGANMNPARSFAPALLNGDWSAHWVYWVGPLAAAVFVGVIYRYMYQTSPPKDDEVEGIPLN